MRMSKITYILTFQIVEKLCPPHPKKGLSRTYLIESFHKKYLASEIKLLKFNLLINESGIKLISNKISVKALIINTEINPKAAFIIFLICF